MKGARTIVIIMLVVFGTLVSKAQDIHFSQFNNSPITLNPALSGVNGCSYRLATNYKAQWTNLHAFQSFAASYDMAIMKSQAKSNFAGFGVSILSDKAGDTNFKTTEINFSFSYTVLLNKKGSQTLSTGLVGGVGLRSFDLNKSTFDSQFAENGYDGQLPTLENIITTNLFYGNVGAGFIWNYNVTKSSNYYVGAAITHLNQPQISFFDNVNERLYMKITFHGGALIPINKQIFLMPSFMYLHQGPHDQLNVGSYLKILKDPLSKDNTAFYVGAWYRWKDALVFAVRVDIASFNIGFSYDLTLSQLSTATLNGGPEVSLIYTGCLKSKKSNVVFCPTL